MYILVQVNGLPVQRTQKYTADTSLMQCNVMRFGETASEKQKRQKEKKILRASKCSSVLLSSFFTTKAHGLSKRETPNTTKEKERRHAPLLTHMHHSLSTQMYKGNRKKKRNPYTSRDC